MSRFNISCRVLYLGKQLKEQNVNYQRVGPISNSRLRCNIRMILYVLKYNFNSSGLYLTRDSLVAYVLALFGLNILLEVHHPGSFFNRVIYLFLSLMQNVSFAPISKQLNNYLINRYKIKNSRIVEWPSTTNVAEYQKSRNTRFVSYWVFRMRNLLSFTQDRHILDEELNSIKIFA